MIGELIMEITELALEKAKEINLSHPRHVTGGETVALAEPMCSQHCLTGGKT